MLPKSLSAITIGFLLIVSSQTWAAPPLPSPSQLCAAGGQWIALDGGKVRLQSGPEIIRNAASQDVVLLGEQHDEEDHHRWQLQMLAALHAQRPTMVIGFEMFPRRVQPVLDQWVAGTLSPREFLKQADWNTVWAFPQQIYMPLFEFARINKIPMIALNIDSKLSRQVAEKGWSKIPLAEREGVGQPAPPLPAYRNFLRDIYATHVAMQGKSAAKGKANQEESFNGFVDSQLAWDLAMAEGLAKELNRKERPLLVGIMGSGHIRFGHGVPHQLRDLGVTRIASLLPIDLDDECKTLRPGMADAVFTLPEKPQPAQEPPRLGVALEDAATGLRISSVTAGSLAEKTGLKSGDRLIELAGRPATSSAEAVSAIRRQPPGTWLPLRIMRGDSEQELIVKFPPQP
jgi:uncharacterized iron-regulated protein